MRTYQADLSRRLGPVFSEMAARVSGLGPYRDAAPEGLVERWNRLRAEDAAKQGRAKAYKPAHGGYPTVKAAA